MTETRIFITGASSGIGAALAEHYAARHAEGIHLGLVARRTGRLVELAERLREGGAVVETYSADVRDTESMSDICRSFDEAAGGVDLAIANAGISLSEMPREGDPAPAVEVVDTNLRGVLNTLLPLIPGMISRKRGHLVAVGSVAGFRGLPGKGAYCGSKAAVKTLMDAYRPVLRPHGIRVTTVCPGWVESEMTANNPYRMPFMVDTPKAAGLIARSIERGRKTYVFPWQMRLAVALMKVIPDMALPNLESRK